jgi:hypothetical protein
MPFFEQAAKFLGFAAEKGATTAAPKVISESISEALSFVHTEEKGFSQIALMKGEEKVGQLKYKPFGEGYTVTGIVGEQKGAGMQLRNELARRARAEGKKFLISDVFGSTSYEGLASWQRLEQQGYNVIQTQVPHAELGLKKPGSKFAYKWMLENEEAEKEAIRVKKAVTLQQAEDTAKNVMKSGEGNDNSTLLKRGLNSTRGSRRTSSVL